MDKEFNFNGSSTSTDKTDWNVPISVVCGTAHSDV